MRRALLVEEGEGLVEEEELVTLDDITRQRLGHAQANGKQDLALGATGDLVEFHEIALVRREDLHVEFVVELDVLVAVLRQARQDITGTITQLAVETLGDTFYCTLEELVRKCPHLDVTAVLLDGLAIALLLVTHALGAFHEVTLGRDETAETIDLVLLQRGHVVEPATLLVCDDFHLLPGRIPLFQMGQDRGCLAFVHGIVELVGSNTGELQVFTAGAPLDDSIHAVDIAAAAIGKGSNDVARAEGTEPGEQPEHTQPCSDIDQPVGVRALGPRGERLQHVIQRLAQCMLRVVGEQDPYDSSECTEQQEQQFEGAEAAALAAGLAVIVNRGDELLAGGAQLVSFSPGRVTGLPDQGKLLFHGVQLAGLEPELLDILLDANVASVRADHAALEVLDLAIEGLVCLFEGQDAGHALDGVAVRMRCRQLALCKIEGFDKLLVLHAEDLLQRVLDGLGATGDRFLVTLERESRTVVAVGIEVP